MNNIEHEIIQSSNAFTNRIWPIIEKDLGGGRIIPVEGTVNNDMANTLDRLSGVDAWQVVGNEHGVRGIASRVQHTNRMWGTFTIRRTISSGGETEWHKRIRAIFYPEKGLLYPTITIQAYLDSSYTGKVLGCGVMRTKDLYLAAVLHDWKINNAPGGNTFLYLEWVKLQDLGYDIKIFKGDN